MLAGAGTVGKSCNFPINIVSKCYDDIEDSQSFLEGAIPLDLGSRIPVHPVGNLGALSVASSTCAIATHRSPQLGALPRNFPSYPTPIGLKPHRN